MLDNFTDSIRLVTATVKKINKVLSVVALVVGALCVFVKLKNALSFKQKRS